MARHNSLQSYPSYIPIEDLGVFDPHCLFTTGNFNAELVCTTACEARCSP